MYLEPEDTVLDIGAGPGRITVPVADKVKGVTALDASKDMQEVLKKNANKAGLSNVTCLNIIVLCLPAAHTENRSRAKKI